MGRSLLRKQPSRMKLTLLSGLSDTARGRLHSPNISSSFFLFLSFSLSLSLFLSFFFSFSLFLFFSFSLFLFFSFSFFSLLFHFSSFSLLFSSLLFSFSITCVSLKEERMCCCGGVFLFYFSPSSVHCVVQGRSTANHVCTALVLLWYCCGTAVEHWRTLAGLWRCGRGEVFLEDFLKKFSPSG